MMASSKVTGSAVGLDERRPNAVEMRPKPSAASLCLWRGLRPARNLQPMFGWTTSLIWIPKTKLFSIKSRIVVQEDLWYELNGGAVYQDWGPSWRQSRGGVPGGGPLSSS